jgi:hypothetical protein
MSSTDRSVIKYFSICGIFASLILFALSFFGRTLSNTAPIIAGLVVTMVGLGLSLTLDPLIPFFCRKFFLTRFWDGKPSWGQPLYVLCFAFLFAQFALFALNGTPTTPVIVDGQPLIGSNGQVVKVFTQAQQLRQDESFLRFFCTIALANFYQLLMYSLFPLHSE